MNDPIHLKYKHTGIIFAIDPYYNPLPFLGTIESPITGEPTIPDQSIW